MNAEHSLQEFRNRRPRGRRDRGRPVTKGGVGTPAGHGVKGHGRRNTTLRGTGTAARDDLA